MTSALVRRLTKREKKARAVRQLLALPGTDAPEDYQEWERRYLDQRTVLDLARSRRVEQEVLDLLDEPIAR